MSFRIRKTHSLDEPWRGGRRLAAGESAHTQSIKSQLSLAAAWRLESLIVTIALILHFVLTDGKQVSGLTADGEHAPEKSSATHNDLVPHVLTTHSTSLARLTVKPSHTHCSHWTTRTQNRATHTTASAKCPACTSLASMGSYLVKTIY